MITRRSFHTSAPNRKIFRLIWWPYFRRWQDLERDYKKEKDEDYKVEHYFRPTDDMYLTPEKRQDGKFFFVGLPFNHSLFSFAKKGSRRSDSSRLWCNAVGTYDRPHAIALHVSFKLVQNA